MSSFLVCYFHSAYWWMYAQSNRFTSCPFRWSMKLFSTLMNFFSRSNILIKLDTCTQWFLPASFCHRHWFYWTTSFHHCSNRAEIATAQVIGIIDDYNHISNGIQLEYVSFILSTRTCWTLSKWNKRHFWESIQPFYSRFKAFPMENIAKFYESN